MVMPFKQLFFKRWKGRKRCMRQSQKILCGFALNQVPQGIFGEWYERP